MAVIVMVAKQVEDVLKCYDCLPVNNPTIVELAINELTILCTCQI